MGYPAFIQATHRTIAVPAALPVGAPFASTTPQRRRLKYKPEYQEWSNWCWAAAAVGVARCYKPDSKWTQCSVAAEALKPLVCCEDGEACNQKIGFGEALRIVGHRNQLTASSISFTEVQGEIDGNRPVGVGITAPGPLVHFIVLFGYIVGEDQYVFVGDPAGKTSLFTFSSFKASYRRGTWTNTYTTTG